MIKNELKPCDCVIGEWIDYESTTIVTVRELLDLVEFNSRIPLNYYFDFRKSVNLTRFKFCPNCGKKIDWKSIKRRVTDEGAD